MLQLPPHSSPLPRRGGSGRSDLYDGMARLVGASDFTREESPLVASAGAGCVWIDPGVLCVVCSEKQGSPPPCLGAGTRGWGQSHY